ncbi:MAG: DUF1549 and DUF1553 domain-containing protein [Opitutales bacterium]|nr:DUF1549 and DUF1553 domain-containing protein [Opitutales bacterium]
MFRSISYLLTLGSLILVQGNAWGTTKLDPAHDMSTVETHWAFVPLEKPAVPETPGSIEGNEVDAFILEKLNAKGLRQADPADKRTLIRRVTYDLTGLPPTFEEVQAFLNDNSVGAYERLVDRLLASEAYGERWARHWLDVARYADSKGIFRRGRYAFSHTYRDYVIQALNEDKPYDQFITEQIAADQMDLGEDNSALAAMGFLTLGRTFFGRKDYIIDDQIDVVTRGLQGLTVSCARCHDHKFDPIPIKDYYSLHGIFASSQDAKELPVIRHPDSEEDYQAYLEEQDRIDAEVREVTEKVIDTFVMEERSLTGSYLAALDEARAIANKDDFKVFAGSKGVSDSILRLWVDYFENESAEQHPLVRSWLDSELEGEARIEDFNQRFAEAAKGETDGYSEIKAYFDESDSPLNPDRDDVEVWIRRTIGGKTGDLSGEKMTLEWTHPGAPFRAHVLEDIDKPKNSSVYLRGDPKNLGEEVPRKYLQILGGESPEPFHEGSGRLELAHAIASEDNPLTARVFVNRVWGWHMGNEIVDTPSDFGVRTPEPAQIDLLNWLASSFIESGWSVKALHRLIVLSNTYRLSSLPIEVTLAQDSSNVLWHYYPKARLDFESMRDTLLMVSGNLDRTMGGLQVDITDPTTNRRTVYAYIDRRDVPGIFRTFDHPSPEATSPARFETVVPQQALFLMNSPFVIEQSKHLAQRSMQEAGEVPEDRIRYIYQVLYQREATAEEVIAGLEFVDQASLLPMDELSGEDAEQQPLSSWELYSQVLLFSNELMFLD